MSPLTILTAKDIDHLTSAPTFLPRIIDSQRSVFSAFSSQSTSSPSDDDKADGPGDIQIPHRLTVVTPQHKVLVMPSRAAHSGGTGCKIVSVPTVSGDTKGLPGSTVVLDESTGAVVGMVNSRTLTALRNACGSALFYQSVQPIIEGKYRSHAGPRNLTVFGSGHQSFHHISVFLTLFPTISFVTIIGRSASSRLKTLVEKLSDEWRGNIGGKGIWRGDHLGKRKVEFRWGVAHAVGEEGENGIESGPPQPDTQSHPEETQARTESVVPTTQTPIKYTLLSSLNSAVHDIPLLTTPARGSNSDLKKDPELEKARKAMETEDEADVSDFEMIDDGGASESISVRKSGFGGSKISSTPNGSETVDGQPTGTSIPTINPQPANSGSGSATTDPKPKTPFDLPQTLHNSHIIICCTPSMTPLFRTTHLTSGTTIILIGSYTPVMQEVEPSLVHRAGCVVVDSREDCEREAGELIRAKKEGAGAGVGLDPCALTFGHMGGHMGG